MGELGKDWLRGVEVTVPVTGGGGEITGVGEAPSLVVMLATGQYKDWGVGFLPCPSSLWMNHRSPLFAAQAVAKSRLHPATSLCMRLCGCLDCGGVEGLGAVRQGWGLGASAGAPEGCRCGMCILHTLKKHSPAQCALQRIHALLAPRSTTHTFLDPVCR